MSRTLAVLAAVVLLIPAGQRTGAQIIPVEQSRYVSTFSQYGYGDPGSSYTIQAAAFEVFDKTLSRASQYSEIQSLQVIASGTATGYHHIGGIWNTGVSYFDLKFDVTAPVTFSLTSQLANHGSFPSFSLSGPDGSILTGSGQASGLLVPGRYELKARAYSDGDGSPDGSGDCSFSFSMTVTPEPATLSLLALGGLLITRRRA